MDNPVKARLWKFVTRICCLITAIGASSLLFSCAPSASKFWAKEATRPDESPIVAASRLPADVVMNGYAGLGSALIVTVHLENGPEFQCLVDTGSASSLLPKSVAGQLGKRVLTVKMSTSLDDPMEKVNIYKTPKIYLGDTPLVTGDRVGMWDGSRGLLGMDCLRHYCIQLDFQARRMRFLDPDRVDAADLGKPFPLLKSPYAYIRHPGLFDQKDTELLVDTGDAIDGRVSARLLKEVILSQNAQSIPLKIIGDVKGPTPELMSVPNCVWDGETYTNLLVDAGRPTLIGLKFLGRHQVTFDFPNRIMYLKSASADLVKE